MRPSFPSVPLVRRREVWLPTWQGLLLLVGGVVAVALVFFVNAYRLLAPQDPAPGATVLVVEGWLDRSDLEQAVVAWRSGRYERVVTTGGPIVMWDHACTWKNYAERAAGHLRARGVPADAAPAPASQQERTFLSAVVLREWLREAGLRPQAVDLFSAGVHARRSRRLFEMALGPQVQVGIVAATPATYDAQRWWTSSAGAKAVVGEVLGVAWTTCCFWPGPAGTHEERWAVPK